jgi:excisionase family DNA binding protein
MQNDLLLTIEDAARRLGMRPITLRMWASRRKIARCKIGRSVRIPESEVERIISASLVPALPERRK